MSPFDRIRAARSELQQAHADLSSALKVERSRKRGSLNRDLHEVRRMLNADYPYKSQAAQDAIVDSVLSGKRGGTFVDVGGYDGVTGSNTLFFEQLRGWSGVLVEPVGSQIAKARESRRCPCLQYAVAPERGTAQFIAVIKGYTQMSGLAAQYDPQMLETVRSDPRHEEELVEVETRTLSDILTESGIAHPDFVSLDIEGGEVAALEVFPFDQHRVRIWSIENNTKTSRIREIMEANGYQLFEFAGEDELYRLAV